MVHVKYRLKEGSRIQHEVKIGCQDFASFKPYSFDSLEWVCCRLVFESSGVSYLSADRLQEETYSVFLVKSY